MDYITYAVPFFLLALLAELAYGIAIKKNTYRLNDAISNLFMGTLRTANKLIIIGAAGYVFYTVETKFALWRMDASLAITWIFAFVIYDFFIIGFIASVMKGKFFGLLMPLTIKARITI